MPGHISRTRLTGKIVAEFLPPSRERKTQKVVILCDGMPSIPRKQSLSEFLATKGFWVIYLRYLGAWRAAVSFWSGLPMKTYSTSSMICQGEWKKLRSVGASGYRRAKSSSSGEASGGGSNPCIP